MLSKFFECEANKHDNRVIIQLKNIAIVEDFQLMKQQNPKIINDNLPMEFEENIDAAIQEFELFCKRREDEKYINNCFEIETVKIVYKN